jgi:GNAT superfamily N-acetyltransferase
MDIMPLDLDDDVVLKEVFGVVTRSDSVSRVRPVLRTEEEFVKRLRFDFPGEREEHAVAVLEGSPAGCATVVLPLRDNVDKCWVALWVDPRHRRHGVGSALVHWAEQQAREAGRDLLLAEVFVPVGGRDAHADRDFAVHRGYAVATVEIVRSLELPVPVHVLSRQRARAAEAMGDAYELSVHVDGVPEELRQGVCDASNRLVLDAPTGDVEFEPESMTVDDYGTMLQHQRDTGQTMVTTVAVHRETGVVAAYTDLCIRPGDPSAAVQWGTLVLPEHRGHRLGMAVKVANLEELGRLAPERRWVETMNDEQNPWMVRINEDLGFRIFEECLSMTKVL